MDFQALFREGWERAARRVNVGKHIKDSIQFFLEDGESRRVDIPLMRDEAMQDAFLRETFWAINSNPVVDLFFIFEAWFLDPNIEPDKLDEFLGTNPRPKNHPRRKEGVNFYYEHRDGTILMTLAEIRTEKKKKRTLCPLGSIEPVVRETRLSHLFKKARAYEAQYMKWVESQSRPI